MHCDSTAGDACEEADFVFFQTDDWLTGIWGPIERIHSYIILMHLRPKLIGLSVEDALLLTANRQSARHSAGHWAIARTACNLAVWDLKGKAAKVPVHQLLGEIKRETIACYASLLGYDLLAPPSEPFLTNLNEDYWGLKWAARIAPHDGERGLRQTVDALAHLRNQGVHRLMLDALTNWTAEYALEFLRMSEHLELEWLEEPVDPTDFASYRRVASAKLAPIAAGEHAYSLYDVQNLIDSGVGILQPDASWCGGLSELQEICRCAAGRVRPVFPHGGGLLPALHLSVTWPDSVIPALEYHLTVEPKRQRFWRHKYVPHQGILRAPEMIGLGVELDEMRITRRVDFRTIEWRSEA